MRAIFTGAMFAAAIWGLVSCTGDDGIDFPYGCVAVGYQYLIGEQFACCGYVCGISGHVTIPSHVKGMAYQYSIIVSGQGSPVYTTRQPDPKCCEVLLAAVYCGEMEWRLP